MLSKYIIEIKKIDIIKFIGSGSYGQVYLVENRDTHQRYAAKFFNNEYSTENEQIQFCQEIEILMIINHPAIISFDGFNFKNLYDQNYPTIFTKYVPNGSLFTLLKPENFETKWTKTNKFIIILGIALGMNYLHNNNIIHRDLKPDNILLDEYLYPYICDFGLSKIHDSNLSSIYMSGEYGNAFFCPPEILLKKKYTCKADVYSFGLILYQIITGNPPMVVNGYENRDEIVNGVRPDTSMIESEEIETLIQSCWSGDPDNRPSFDEIINIICQYSFYSYFDIDRENVQKYLEKFEEDVHLYDQENTPLILFQRSFIFHF